MQAKAKSGISGSVAIQRFKVATEQDWHTSKAEFFLSGFRLIHDPAGGYAFWARPNSRRIVVPNLFIDVGRVELVKRLRFQAGSARTIKVLAVGSGYSDPARTDIDLETPLASKDIPSWDDALLTPDSGGLQITIANVLWLSGEANGTISEIGLKYDDASLLTHSLFKKMTISGATNDNPVRITVTANHNLATGDEVRINSVGGMTEINDRDFVITTTGNPQKFDLDGEDGTGHGTYTASTGFAFLQVIKSAAEVVQTDYRLDFTG